MISEARIGAHKLQGIGRSILTLCEDAARAEGCGRVELMATLAGEPLYRACGYIAVERIEDDCGGVPAARLDAEGPVTTARRPRSVAGRRAT